MQPYKERLTAVTEQIHGSAEALEIRYDTVH